MYDSKKRRRSSSPSLNDYRRQSRREYDDDYSSSSSSSRHVSSSRYGKEDDMNKRRRYERPASSPTWTSPHEQHQYDHHHHQSPSSSNMTTSSVPYYNGASSYGGDYYQQQQQQQQNTVSSDAIDPACRIYVGNINYELSQHDIKRSFLVFGSIRNIMMNRDPVTRKHKGYCFIDYETAESAANAITGMNGFLMGGRSLKLGRPKPIPGMMISSTNTSASTITTPYGAASSYSSSNVSQTNDESNKIYVGNVHWDVTEQELISVFSAFGTVVSCQLTPNPETNKHKGFGFIEYTTAQQAEDAIHHLDGFLLVDRKLKVGRVIHGVGHRAVQQKLPDISSSNNNSNSCSLDEEEDVQIKGPVQRSLVMQRFLRESNIGSSRCILLTNMITENDPEIESDISSECSKYGLVEKVIVYTERPNCIKIFVLFKDPSEAAKARTALDKRYFAGRVVNAQFYSDHQFLAGVYNDDKLY